MEKRENDKDIKHLKAENSQMENDVGKIRTKNEKVARAIRNIKDNPDVVSKVSLLISQGQEKVED